MKKPRRRPEQAACEVGRRNQRQAVGRDIVTKVRMVCISGEAQGSSTGEGKTE